MVKKIDVMLFRMMKQSKGQFIAVLVIIAVGVAIFTGLTMAAVNLENTKDDYYAESHFADLFTEASNVPSSMMGRLQAIEGVSVAEGRLTMDVPFIAEEDEPVNVRLLSTNGEKQQINRLTVSEGRHIKDPNKEALVYQPFAEARGIEEGDEIQVQVNGVGYTLSVCGIVRSSEFIYLMENEQSLMPNPKKIRCGLYF